MQKSIMIIGGGLLQVPVIQTAKKMGLQTIVTDYNKDAIGIHYADVPLIMSTRDIEGSVRIAKKQNQITPISGVLTVGTDASMTVSAVANALNLPGIKFEDAEAATNKIKMRQRFKNFNIPVPDFFAVWSLADAKAACVELGFPVVIKPSDNMGARGVIYIENNNTIADAFKFAKAASPSGELIIEKYMHGEELSIDAVIYNKEIIFSGIADRIIEDLPYFIEKGHTMPSQLSKAKIKNACDVMKKGIRALGIENGFAKGDIKITSEGARIGELAARLSGGFMSTYTYPLSSGVDLIKAAIELSMGQEPGNLEPVYNKISIERAIILEPGTVKKITGLEKARQVPGIAKIFLNVKPGDHVVKPRSNVEKAGNIIAVAETLKDAEHAINLCRDLLKFEISKEEEISLDLIQAAAREKLTKVCYVCKDCNGENCPTGVPGMGGAGKGNSFRINFHSLAQYKINTRVIHNILNPDISTTFFGYKLSFPVMAAPITGAVTNLGGAISEIEYANSVINGCDLAGTLAFVGDGASPEKYKIGLKAIEKNNGNGIAIFKPRSNINEIIKRVKAAEKAGALAVGIDIDAVVFKTMKMQNQAVGPKSRDELKEIISSTSLPFILKGIMHPEDAIMAVEAGAHAIIISNHGGRVLDEMPGTMDVLPEIVNSVKNNIRILIDGGFRSGVDIFKGLAAGADAVLIGRPIVHAVVGMKEKGVIFYLNQLKKELINTMILTGCASINDIDTERINITNNYLPEYSYR